MGFPGARREPGPRVSRLRYAARSSASARSQCSVWSPGSPHSQSRYARSATASRAGSGAATVFRARRIPGFFTCFAAVFFAVAGTVPVFSAVRLRRGLRAFRPGHLRAVALPGVVVPAGDLARLLAPASRACVLLRHRSLHVRRGRRREPRRSPSRPFQESGLCGRTQPLRCRHAGVAQLVRAPLL